MKNFFDWEVLKDISQKIGTPTYVYSEAALKSNIKKIFDAFNSYPTLACYAVKANSNLSLLSKIFSVGLGADVVSIGELEKSLLAGVDPNKIVFSGVGKKREELIGAVQKKIFAILVESEDEIQTLRELDLSHIPRVAIRINPNIEVKTNPHIATGLYSHKFGVGEAEAQRLIKTYFKDGKLKLVGLSCHLGSQIFDPKPYHEAAARLSSIAESLIREKFPLEFLDVGGGFGIPYDQEIALPIEEYATAIIPAVKKTNLRLLIEPGRFVMGNVGILLSQLITVKKNIEKTFYVVDAGMNDLIRPTLYDAYHGIETLKNAPTTQIVDVVGPVCETGDYLARDRHLPQLQKGDLLYIKDCGAYGFSMASHYNCRPKAAEVLIGKDGWRVIRKRESLAELWKGEIGKEE